MSTWIVYVRQSIRHIFLNTIGGSFIVRCCHSVSGHRSYLATAIDILSYPGITLNGDRRVTTYQCRVTMCLYALTTTEHTVFDLGCTGGGTCCHTISESDGYRCIHFHSTDFTTAIDRAMHNTISNDNSRIAIRIVSRLEILVNTSTIDSHHGFLAGERGCFTLTTSEHITMISVSLASNTDGYTSKTFCI